MTINMKKKTKNRHGVYIHHGKKVTIKQYKE